MEFSQVTIALVAVVVGAVLSYLILQRSSKAQLEGAIATNGAELQASLASTKTELQQMKAVAEERAARALATDTELKQERQKVADALQSAGVLKEEIGKLGANLSKEALLPIEWVILG